MPKKAKDLIFVVQKHQARNLHYDFRLEADGVLKSWAVPKGPSMLSREKRLAMQTEDHPFPYKDFEGVIPSGYGAGTVLTWDEGTYLPVSGSLEEGRFKFLLNGSRLKGQFVLFRFDRAGENAWILQMLSGSEIPDVISKYQRSVKSGRTIEEIAVQKDLGNKKILFQPKGRKAA